MCNDPTRTRNNIEVCLGWARADGIYFGSETTTGNTSVFLKLKVIY